MKALIKYYWPTILWALFVFTLCSIRLGTITESPAFFPGFDKLVHTGFFFVFVIFYCNGFIRQHNTGTITYTTALLVLVLAITYGGAIELLQWLVFTWRDGDWNDLFADSLGASMGIFSVMIISSASNYAKK